MINYFEAVGDMSMQSTQTHIYIGELCKQCSVKPVNSSRWAAIITRLSFGR